MVIPRVTAPGGTFGGAVGIVGRAVSVGRHRNRRFVPTVVGITGLALGRTVTPIGLAAVRTAVIAPVPAVVAVSGLALGRTVAVIAFTAVRRRYGGTVDTVVDSGNFTFGRTVVPVFFAVIGNVHTFPDVAVVGIGHLADRGTGRRIIFGAAVRPFVNSGRTDAVGILSTAAVPRYRTRIRTVGRSILIFRLADAGLIFSAAFGTGTVFFGRTGNQRGVAFAGSVHFVAAFADTDLSGGTGDKVGQTFAAKPVGGVIGTNAVNGLYGIAVLSDKAFVQTLVSRIDIKVVIGRTGAGRGGIITGGAAAVADPEETDAGGLIRARHVGKGRCRLRNRCVCMCVFKCEVIVREHHGRIQSRSRRHKNRSQQSGQI